jgi:adenylate cyclase
MNQVKSVRVETSTNGTLINEIADWLIEQALGKVDLQVMSEQFYNRVYAAGIPISRGHISFDTLHPLFAAVSMEWKPGRGIETNYRPHISAKTTDAWKDSPFYALIENNLTFLRRHLVGEEAVIDFPILEGFIEQGGTDYLAFMIPFGNTRADGGIIGSWLTNRPGGFSDREIACLLRIQKRLGVAYKIGIREQISENIATTYLGRSAGRMVLNGNIKRGDGEDIFAVIWFCDLRNSVKLANTLPRGEFLILLNGFLECMAGAVLDNGGEVLRFIGDAALAIFPIKGTAEGDCLSSGVHCQAPEACENALQAAQSAAVRVADLNQQRKKDGKAVLDYGIGLHIGDVMYGNIGSPERLEFTVIGSAANMAARIESQCKPLKKKLLISSDFAKIHPGKLQSIGLHHLAGIDGDQELFTTEAP